MPGKLQVLGWMDARRSEQHSGSKDLDEQRVRDMKGDRVARGRPGDSCGGSTGCVG